MLPHLRVDEERRRTLRNFRLERRIMRLECDPFALVDEQFIDLYRLNKDMVNRTESHNRGSPAINGALMIKTDFGPNPYIVPVAPTDGWAPPQGSPNERVTAVFIDLGFGYRGLFDEVCEVIGVDTILTS
ncbi:hypothetical protein JTB14_023645 [Gonioctena quinquepunctata]|nr:hypothetical protein JTB14_023645 [Gonioctena quinquepunctata]